MGEPQRSDAVESDRRSSPRFPAELLGKASVRLLGGSEVTLINFSERGILFQSETRLLVGARGTVRIVVGTETTVAAGTVVRSLVQGMASGKLAFHTALALDQPLALAAGRGGPRARQAGADRASHCAEPPADRPTRRCRAGRARRGRAAGRQDHREDGRRRRPRRKVRTPRACRRGPARGRRRTAASPRAARAGARTGGSGRRGTRDATGRGRGHPGGRAAARRSIAAGSGFDNTGFDGGSFGWADAAGRARGRRR